MLVIGSSFLLNVFDFFFTARIKILRCFSQLIQRQILMTSNDTSLFPLIKTATLELWYLAELMTERYAYTLLLSVTSKIAVFVVDLYWVYLRIIYTPINMDFLRRKHNEKCVTSLMHSFSAAFILCLHPLISLIGVFSATSSAANEYKHISYCLHKLTSNQLLTENELRQVKAISFQLMTTSQKFTIMGFSEISNSTLLEVNLIYS